ncbi:glycosyltransferase [Paractinoplanes maris]|uniref:glycosyltransferase n=1 Tax=Paractinoplanes maris TaxID=1734446 RepID=UPI0020203CCA|nr:glycosyltransferase [Actinoplanes maris]
MSDNEGPGRRVALVHEWFDSVGGSEQVFLEISNTLPSADRYVLWREGAAVDGPPMKESWLSRTPLRRHKALALPFMLPAWRMLDGSGYDLVLSSSHAFAHSAKFRDDAGTRYLSYVHTPARYVWSPELDVRGGSPLLSPVRAVLRRADVAMTRHVHSYAANSNEVRTRIRRYWGRECRVIHPPVDVDYFAPSQVELSASGREYLLGVGRWISYKRFDLMIEIAETARVPLVIAGGGPEEDRLRRLAANARVEVRFVTRPSKAQLRALYVGALALLYPTHEDFGMVPVEAQASGTPVIGLGRGGLLETVLPGETGFLADSFEPADYAALVHRLSEPDRSATIANAQRFSIERFRAQITDWVREEGLS